MNSPYWADPNVDTIFGRELRLIMIDIGRDNFRSIAKEVLENGRSLTFVAGGSSMAPFIKNGDIVEIQPDRSLRVGDVAFLKNREDRLLLHRIIKITEDGIVTRGDACYCDDGFTPFGDVLGKVIKSSGFNSHLRFPFGRLIALGFIRPSKLRRHRLFMYLAKRVAWLLG